MVKFKIWRLNGITVKNFFSFLLLHLFCSLGPLVNKVKEYQVETIVEALCANMISEKEQLRDISSIGLKTVIAELPQAPGGFSGNICKRITGRLTTAIERVWTSYFFLTLNIIIFLFHFSKKMSLCNWKLWILWQIC